MKEQVLKQSQVFWKGLEKADTAAMRSVCDDKCFFVHIGGNCDLDKEMEAFDKKIFQPTEITLHGQEAHLSVTRPSSSATWITACCWAASLRPTISPRRRFSRNRATRGS